MKRFSHFILLPVSVACGCMLLGCAAPNQSFTGKGGESRTPASSHTQTWIDTTYVSGQVLQDDDTWVGGGADGSSFLVVRNKLEKETTWVFLNGNYMYLQLPGVRPEIVTHTPGSRITSKAGDWPARATSPIDMPEITYYLRNLYEAFQVLHVPFLTGEGWPETSEGTRGADADDAEWILARMSLDMRRIGSNQTGKVLKQVPAGGRPVSAGTTVRVWLDGSQSIIDAGLNTLGDTYKTAISIAHQGTVKKKITKDYHDTLPKTSCDLIANGKEIFWELPDDAKGKMVTVVRINRDKRVTISAWKGDPDMNVDPTPIGCDGATDCCARGLNPSITFIADASLITFVVIDVNPTDLEEEPLLLKIKVSW